MANEIELYFKNVILMSCSVAECLHEDAQNDKRTSEKPPDPFTCAVLLHVFQDCPQGVAQLFEVTSTAGICQDECPVFVLSEKRETISDLVGTTDLMQLTPAGGNSQSYTPHCRMLPETPDLRTASSP